MLALSWVAWPSVVGAQETDGEAVSDSTAVLTPADSSLTIAPVPTDSTSDQDSGLELKLGGGLRLNYAWQTYNEARKDRVGDFGFEVFMGTVNASVDDIFLAAQYRWYAGFQAIRYGYIGIEFSPELEGQVGIHQVPFGILPWASHSFWFGATYYMGFEDDYDAGLKLVYRDGPWNLQAAFYKNAEYLDKSRDERYSFDLVTGDEQGNSETNQLNGRVARRFEWDPVSYVDVGGSVMYGGIYNESTTDMGDRWAAALHSDFHLGPWNLQLEGIRYQFNPENPVDVDPSTVQLGAFGSTFLMASDGWEATFNIAREFRPKRRFLESVLCYGDLSRVFPNGASTHTSTQIVTGCLLVKGGLYIYNDWVTGQNMWFIGGPGIGLSTSESGDWKGRLNINVAYYF